MVRIKELLEAFKKKSPKEEVKESTPQEDIDYLKSILKANRDCRRLIKEECRDFNNIKLKPTIIDDNYYGFYCTTYKELEFAGSLFKNCLRQTPRYSSGLIYIFVDKKFKPVACLDLPRREYKGYRNEILDSVLVDKLIKIIPKVPVPTQIQDNQSILSQLQPIPLAYSVVSLTQVIDPNCVFLEGNFNVEGIITHIKITSDVLRFQEHIDFFGNINQSISFPVGNSRVGIAINLNNEIAMEFRRNLYPRTVEEILSSKIMLICEHIERHFQRVEPEDNQQVYFP